MTVFGMGLGESILLRFHTNDEVQWAVVDSARKKVKGVTINPALEVLKTAGAFPSLVVFTHPHRDHAKGMADLVRRALPGARVGCVEPLMEDEDELSAIVLDDDRLANDVGQTTLAHAAICTAWREAQAQRLVLQAEAEPFEFCGWEVTVLHPPRALAEEAAEAMRQGREPNLNNVSAILSLTRESVSFLLAGDGEEAAWDDVEARIDPAHLRDAHPLKVPHHGSVPALHPVVVDRGRPTAREQVVTPFPMSGTLPTLGPGGGAERLIQAGGSLRLTAMPVSALPKKQSLSLAEARSALQHDSFAGDDEEIPITALRPEETAVFEAGERDPRECWVVLEVDSSGIVTAELGAHAVTLS
jgi:beta-lactamase superfamily II metal-dependent hydrolase